MKSRAMAMARLTTVGFSGHMHIDGFGGTA
jgi:hypothetical protein